MVWRKVYLLVVTLPVLAALVVTWAEVAAAVEVSESALGTTRESPEMG